MARAADFITCPSCGSRNKTKWEFCAKCGDSLAGAEVSKPDHPAATVVTTTVAQPDGGGSGSLLGLVALVAVFVAGVVYFASQQEGAPPVSPGTAEIFAPPPT